MKSIVHFCQGESHKSSDKPCQDYAYAESSPDLSMAIVCDGHGGERYFRSQVGSEAAIKVTKNAVKDFLNNLDYSSYTRDKRAPLFVGEKFTDYIAENTPAEQADIAEHQALMWLFSNIISEWHKEIANDAVNRDLTEWEIAHVEQQYLDEFDTSGLDISIPTLLSIVFFYQKPIFSGSIAVILGNAIISTANIIVCNIVVI